MSEYLPRRDFLVRSALAACGLLVPVGFSRSLRAARATAAGDVLDALDRAVIAELAAYSSDVYFWDNPSNFTRPRNKGAPPAAKSTNFLVRVTDFHRLIRYLNSKSLARLGVVYAGGPNLAFVVGTTAYTVTNYGPDDFERAVRVAAAHAGA
jgi:hypothetical protein